MTKATQYIALIGVNAIYACTSLCTKYASQQAFMSWGYIVGIIGAVGIMGIYAILWQQVLKRVPLSDAYMFKGTSLIFVMLLAWVFFGETITWTNLLGVAIIIFGIALFARE